MCSRSLVSCQQFPVIIRTDAKQPAVSSAAGRLYVIGSCELCPLSPPRLVSLRKMEGGRQDKSCCGVLVISQCPPPSRWTTSGKSQHLGQQGGLVIIAA